MSRYEEAIERALKARRIGEGSCINESTNIASCSSSATVRMLVS
jgi:hypothetical protein